MKKFAIIIICALLLVVAVGFALFAVNNIREYLYPREYSEYVTKYANEYKVPESLVYAVIYNESSFKKEAVSPVGAIGLMQLMPDTVDWLSRVMGESAPDTEISNPEVNIKYGTYYIRHLYDRFGDWDTAIAAYNAGHGRVGGWLSDERYSDDGVTLKLIPITETKNYVNRVKETQNQYKTLYYNGED